MIDKFSLVCALSLFYTEICHWFIQQIYLACLFVSGYKTLVLDGFSAKRLHLATSLIDRSSNQREPSGGLNRPWCQQRGRKPEGLEEASDSPGVWFGTSFCLCLPSGPHRGRDCGQVLSQTTVLGRTSPLKAAQHWAECGEEGAGWPFGALFAKQSWTQQTRPPMDSQVEVNVKRSVCISVVWVT